MGGSLGGGLGRWVGRWVGGSVGGWVGGRVGRSVGGWVAILTKIRNKECNSNLSHLINDDHRVRREVWVAGDLP